MSTADLNEQEWNYILGVLGERPWREANGVLMKIGSQLRMQQQQANSPFMPRPNGGEYAGEQKQRFGEHPAAASRRVPSPSGDSDRTERGEEGGTG